LYLKSLILKGFKSFGKKCELFFDSGISVIVGPNGSGKSNIADAISWVLGEQSPKSLRSSSMDEVIFKNKNEELGIAEVSLIFDNKDKKIPLEFRDIKFTRKVYSRGGSDYYINSSPSRLIDIQDIISDAGIGKGLYTIISQGTIDDIAVLKPLERKIVVEEIIGITKHKNRKEKSINKLNSISENISRIDDVILEIKKTMNPLRVEAEKAKKYFEVKNDLKEQELSYYLFQLDNLNEQWEKINSKIKGQKEKDEKIKQSEKDLENIDEKTIKELEDLESKHTSHQEYLNTLNRLLNDINNYNIIILSKINNFNTLHNLTDPSIFISSPANITGKTKDGKDANIIDSLIDLKNEIERFVRSIKSHFISVEMVLEIEQAKAKLESKIERIIEELKSGKNIYGEEKNIKKEVKTEIFYAIKDLAVKNIDRSRSLKKINDGFSEILNKFINKTKPLLEKYEDLLRVKNKESREREDKKIEIMTNKSNIENELFRLGVRSEQIKEKVKDITSYIIDDYNISIEYLQKKYSPCKDKESTVNKIKELKKDLKSIGTVNPNARLEYNRIKERYDFLSSEKADLVESKSELDSIISDIDARIKSLFLENFSTINENFQRNFKLLFPLGDGELILKGRLDNIDEIGIDLKIDMGNNKLVPLTLLSGGEKALVSIAFLFSVYALNFSPFYLLDEVDAALDDTNLNRFLNLLKDFSKSRQVILITHQKRTMEVADTIYGVSMQSNGISKIVSVKLNGDEKNH